MGEETIANLAKDLVMTAILLVLYLKSLAENAKLIEQARADSLRHEQIILEMAKSLSRCPVIKE